MRDHDHDTAASLHILGIVLAGVAFALGVYATGCAPMPGPEPMPPIDAGACSDGVHDACDIAATHLCELGCGFTGGSGIDRVPGNADDDTFAEACRAISFDTTCLASATTCAQAESCQ
jgi:hypothetical protein